MLSRDDLEHAIEEAERTKQPLPAVLLRSASSASKDLTAALADQLGVPFVDFLETPIHQDAPTLLTAELARQLRSRCRSTSRATSSSSRSPSPPTTTRVAAVGAATTYEIIPAVADRDELVSAIDMIYGAADRGRATARRRRGRRPATSARSRRAAHQRPARRS